MADPLRVFVASTEEDLESFRTGAREEILNASWVPVLSQYFGATPSTTLEECRSRVRSCDLVLLLVAWRNGWVPNREQGGDGERTITAWEVAEAKQHGIPVLMFRADDGWPVRWAERTTEGWQRISRFRASLNQTAPKFSYEENPARAGSSFRMLVRRALLDYAERQRTSDPPAAPPPPRPRPTEIIDFSVERLRHVGLCGREDLLDLVLGWLREPDPPPWVGVVGMPGVGKTAFLVAILERLESAGLRTPHHFARRHRGNWDRPEAMARSLSAQVEALFPEQARADAPPENRLLELLGRVSAERLVPKEERLHLLVDGLEELADERGPEAAVRAYLPHALPPRVHVLCSSRPHPPLVEWLQQREGIRILDLDERRDSNEAACRAWWEKHAASFRPPLTEDLVREAVRRSEGNLLYTVMLGDWFRSVPAQERRPDGMPKGLTGFFREMWRRVQASPEPSPGLLSKGIAVLCAARESLSAATVSSVAGWTTPKERDFFFDRTRTFLLEEAGAVPASRAYRPFHERFRQFMLEEGLGTAAVRSAHRELAGRLAAWPVPAGASEADRMYACRHAIWHRVDSGDVGGATALCRDAEYLREACTAAGIAALEDALQAVVAQGPGVAGGEHVPAVLRALRHEAHWLRRDPSMLPTALFNRLKCMGLQPEEVVTFRGVCAASRIPRLRFPLDVQNVAAVRTLEGHSREVVALSVLRHQAILASASADGVVQFWRLSDGQLAHSWNAPAPSVGALCGLEDGRLAIGAGDGRIFLYDPRSAGAPRVIDAHVGSVLVLAMGADGRLLSGGRDGFVRSWNVATGRAESEFVAAGADSLGVMALAPLDRARLATCTGADSSIQVWAAASPEGSFTLADGDAPVLALARHVDGKLVSGAATGTLRVWDVDERRVVRTLRSGSNGIFALTGLADGRVACGLVEGMIRVIDPDSGEASRPLRAHDGNCVALAELPDGRLASASEDRTVRVWDVATRGPPEEVGSDPRHSLALTALDEVTVVAASTDGRLRVHDLRSGQETRVLRGGHHDWVTCVARLDDGTVASGSLDGEVRIWETGEGEMVSQFRHRPLVPKGEPQAGVNAVLGLPEGRIATGGADGVVRIWTWHGPPRSPQDADDPWGGKPRPGLALEAHKGEVVSLARLEGGRLASGDTDGRIRVWSTDGPSTAGLLDGHDDQVRALLPLSGGRLASGSADHTIRIWAVNDGSPIRVLEGHEDWVWSLADLGDDRIASASSDRTIRVWDLRGHDRPLVIPGPAYFLTLCAFGHVLVAADRADQLWVLEIPAR